MEEMTYNNIGPVLQLNKAGELIQKRMKAAKVCVGLYLSAPDRTQFVNWIIEFNGVKWIEHTAPVSGSNPDALKKRMPAILASIEAGKLNNLNDYHKELHRRIFSPEQPAIMELKQPERIKAAPLAEGERKVSVMMYKGYTNEITDKKVIISEVAPHIYSHVYRLARYGERVKIIFEIDGVYFQGADEGAYIMEREDFAEICRKAYDHARENIAEGAAKGMSYFVELAKRIEAAQTEQHEETTEATNISAEEDKREETANIDEINNFISRSGFILEEQFTHDVYRVTKGGKELTSWLTLSELWRWICDSNKVSPKSAPQSTQTAPMANYAAPKLRRARRANIRPNSAARRFRTTRRIILLTPANCSPANSPPIGSPSRTLSTGSN